MSALKLHGYEVDDSCINLPCIPPIKAGIRIRRKPEDKERTLDTGMINGGHSSQSLPTHIRGAAPTIPNTSHVESLLAGYYYRVCRAHNPISPAALRNLRSYTHLWCKQNLIPLEPWSDTSFESWIVKTNYTLARQEEIRRAYHRYKDGEVSNKKLMEVKGFMKEEDYKMLFKYPRTINSRSDSYKAAVGPILKLIEKQLFARPEFIKKISGRERAQYIMDQLEGMPQRYVTTDYTSYEGSFTKELMEKVEFIMYDYMTQYLPERGEFMQLMKAQLQVNHIKYKGFKSKILSTRMSGEMNTSLGNSFSNLILFSWVCDRQDITFKGVVEGDDGLFAVSSYPNFDLITSVGFTIKREEHVDIGDASFCGQVFDKDAMQPIRDAVASMVSMGWSSSQYKNSNSYKLKQLEKARAMSYLYECPACPILNVYCREILAKHWNVNIGSLVEKLGQTYQRERFIRASKHELKFEEPSILTRLLFERRYGITVDEQILIENEIQANLGDCMELPFLLQFVGEASITMWNVYVNHGDRVRDKVLRSAYRQNVAEDMFIQRKLYGLVLK